MVGNTTEGTGYSDAAGSGVDYNKWMLRLYKGPGRSGMDNNTFQEIQLMWDMITQSEVEEERECPMVALKHKGNMVLVFPGDSVDQEGFISLVPRLAAELGQELTVIKASEEDPTAILSIKIPRHLAPTTTPRKFLENLQKVNSTRRGGKAWPKQTTSGESIPSLQLDS